MMINTATLAMSADRTIFELQAMVLQGARISWEIPHARERAIGRDVPVFEAERIIRSPGSCRLSVKDGEVRWRASGYDSDGRPVDVVVKPVGDSVLRVVTVIRTDE